MSDMIVGIIIIMVLIAIFGGFIWACAYIGLTIHHEGLKHLLEPIWEGEGNIKEIENDNT